MFYILQSSDNCSYAIGGQASQIAASNSSGNYRPGKMGCTQRCALSDPRPRPQPRIPVHGHGQDETSVTCRLNDRRLEVKCPTRMTLQQPNCLQEELEPLLNKSTKQLLLGIQKMEVSTPVLSAEELEQPVNEVFEKVFYELNVGYEPSPLNSFSRLWNGDSSIDKPLLKAAKNLCKDYPENTIGEMIDKLRSRPGEQLSEEELMWLTFLDNNYLDDTEVEETRGDEQPSSFGSANSKWSLRSLLYGVCALLLLAQVGSAASEVRCTRSLRSDVEGSKTSCEHVSFTENFELLLSLKYKKNREIIKKVDFYGKQIDPNNIISSADGQFKITVNNVEIKALNKATYLRLQELRREFSEHSTTGGIENSYMHIHQPACRLPAPSRGLILEARYFTYGRPNDVNERMVHHQMIPIYDLSLNCHYMHHLQPERIRSRESARAVMGTLRTIEEMYPPVTQYKVDPKKWTGIWEFQEW